LHNESKDDVKTQNVVLNSIRFRNISILLLEILGSYF